MSTSCSESISSATWMGIATGASSSRDRPSRRTPRAVRAAGTGRPRPQRVAQVLPGILYKDMAVVWLFEGQLDGLSPRSPLPRPSQGLQRSSLHLGVLRGGPRATPEATHQAVKGIQDHLGDLQDAVVTCGILRDYITWGVRRDHGHTSQGPRNRSWRRGQPATSRRARKRWSAWCSLPRGLADGRRQRLQPRPGRGDRRDLSPREGHGLRAVCQSYGGVVRVAVELAPRASGGSGLQPFPL